MVLGNIPCHLSISVSRWSFILLHLSFLCGSKHPCMYIFHTAALISVRKLIRRRIAELPLSDGCQVLSPSRRCDNVPKAFMNSGHC